MIFISNFKIFSYQTLVLWSLKVTKIKKCFNIIVIYNRKDVMWTQLERDRGKEASEVSVWGPEINIKSEEKPI